MSESDHFSGGVKKLAQKIRQRSSDLSPFLNGVDAFTAELQGIPDRTYLNKATLHKIAKEKSPRKADLVFNNSDEAIERITALAFSLNEDAKSMQLLCVLDGVNVPTASAILSWMFPEKWPVIDQRAWRVLYNAEIVNTREDGIGLGVPQWNEYMKAVRELHRAIPDLAKTPQQVDRLLFGLDILTANEGDA
ncbi:hypothetical protein [uncultured Jannaschia sp.]|uniref:hypothetical protein n=1 Tax=uncultured Jannaschia sp. TaxID=293347 RepID=UPI00262C2ACB|nr:hypothetical protein [uncultured Jannaschia sp.]